jgi:hypothetical protein
MSEQEKILFEIDAKVDEIKELLVKLADHNAKDTATATQYFETGLLWATKAATNK